MSHLFPYDPTLERIRKILAEREAALSKAEKCANGMLHAMASKPRTSRPSSGVPRMKDMPPPPPRKGEKTVFTPVLKPMPDDGRLMTIVKFGTVDDARAFFDDCFWKGEKATAEWKHLATALLRQDKPLARLLIHWGATVDKESLTQMTAEHKEDYAQTLRRCGYHVKNAPVVPTVLEPEPPRDRADLIPQEWKEILKTAQKKHLSTLRDHTPTQEALIAGGALRDLFNGRAGQIKDVDIFLPRQKSSLEFIKRAFEAAGVSLVKKEKEIVEYASDSYGGRFVNSRKMVAETEMSRVLFNQMDSYTVRSAKTGTAYNFIFTDGIAGVVDNFDIGLCQIAFDGEKIVTTPAYDNDVKNKTITLINSNKGSKEHLQRIVVKYPDFAPCPVAQNLLRSPIRRLLGMKPKGTGHTGPR